MGGRGPRGASTDPNPPALTSLNPSGTKKGGSSMKSTAAWVSNVPDDVYLEEVLLALQAPEHTKPARIADTWNCGLTGAIPPFVRMAVPFVPGDTLTTTTYQAFSADQAFAVLTHAGANQMIVYNPNTGGDTASYTVWFNGTDQQQSVALIPDVTFDQEFYAVKVNFLRYYSGTAFHGPLLPAFSGGDRAGLRYVPMSFGDDITFGFVIGAPFAGQLQLRVSQWTPTGPVYLGSTLFPGTSAGETQAHFNTFSEAYTTFGYYSFVIAWFPAATDPATINVTGFTAALAISFVTGGSGVFQFIGPDGYNSWGQTASAVRQFSTSLLFTNTAAPINKSGSLALVELPLGDYWESLIPAQMDVGFPAVDPNTGYTAVNSIEQSVFMSAIEGSYAWRKPLDDSWMAWMKETTFAAGVVSDVCIDIEGMGPFVVFTSSIVEGEGRAGTFVAAVGLELQTSATWIEQRPCDGRAIALIGLQDRLSKMAQFSENDMHWDQIWYNIKSGISSVANGIIKWAPRVANVASTVAEMIAM
jgi:hypothetical protein